MEGSPRVEGDDDEEDVDDIEHEFYVDDEKNKNKHIAEAMLQGKMSYGRGPEDDDNALYPHVISGGRSRPVSGEFPISTPAHGEQVLSSLHKRVHPYPALESGSTRWDEKKEGGWKERMEEWKFHQGNLGPEADELADPDIAM